MDLQQKLNEIKNYIYNKRKIKLKNGDYDYIPTALRLSYNTLSGWLYSVECIEEKTNSVIHIRLTDVEL